MLWLKTLGRFHVVWNDDHPLNFPSHKTRALLVYLAVSRQRHTRSELASFLWPDHDEVKARNNLRVTLFRLRKVLDAVRPNSPSFITTTRTHVMLGDELSCDLDKFYTLTDSRKKDQPVNIAALEQASALYNDEFLAGFPPGISDRFDDWLLLTRQQVHMRMLQLLDHLLDHYLEQQQFEAMVPLAQRQVELEAWHENGYQRLMLAYANLGKTPDALLAYETCRKVLDTELGVEPADELTELANLLRKGEWRSENRNGQVITIAPVSTLANTAPKNNLPQALPTFFQRTAELTLISQMVQERQARWVTLVGPGGIGKSRLAIEAARSFTPQFEHGVWFVELAGLQNSEGIREQIAIAIADVLKLSLAGGDSAENQLINYLQQKRMLLVLDNWEHVLDGADIVYNLLNKTHQLTILCTSREPLHFQAERLLWVNGLAAPNLEDIESASPLDFPSVQLFVERASRLQPTLKFTAPELKDAAAICHWLSGSPLGIELAASWTMERSIAEVWKTLKTSFDLLQTKMRDVPSRHRSMRTVLLHSWERLNETSRTLMMQASVFQDGFADSAFEAITGQAESALSKLIDVSLIEKLGSGRYRLHEVVRQFSAEHLAQSGTLQQQTQQQHASHYLSTLAELQPTLQGQTPQNAVAEIRRDINNIRVAWQAASTQGASALQQAAIEPLSIFYQIRGLSREGLALFESAAEAAQARDDMALASALTIEEARFHLRLSQFENVSTLVKAYVDGSVKTNPAVRAQAAIWLAEVNWRKTELDSATAQLDLLESQLMPVGVPYLEGQLHHHRSIVQELQENFAAATVSIGRAINIWRQLGNRRLEMYSLNTRGIIAIRSRNLSAAKVDFLQALSIARTIDEQGVLANFLGNVGEILLEEDNLSEAAVYLDEACRISAETGNQLAHAKQLYFTAVLQKRLGDSSAAQTLAKHALEIYQSHNVASSISFVQKFIHALLPNSSIQSVPLAA